MREILFRAKRADNGEWINGYLVELGKESFSDPERYGICNKAIPLGGSVVCYNLKIDEVISETVGQYTGLKDKNGKKIFEGDIVKGTFFGFPFTVEDYVFSIVWQEDVTGYRANYFENVQVIGNIHDNPELLKGDKLF